MKYVILKGGDYDHPYTDNGKLIIYPTKAAAESKRKPGDVLCPLDDWEEA
ncbi:MAG: hypothetical protein H8D74_00890 [Chloroflexi bacterium]|nr:hypothetical protein [Chloroflexota bacterium]